MVTSRISQSPPSVPELPLLCHVAFSYDSSLSSEPDHARVRRNLASLASTSSRTMRFSQRAIDIDRFAKLAIPTSVARWAGDDQRPHKACLRAFTAQEPGFRVAANVFEIRRLPEGQVKPILAHAGDPISHLRRSDQHIQQLSGPACFFWVVKQPLGQLRRISNSLL